MYRLPCYELATHPAFAPRAAGIGYLFFFYFDELQAKNAWKFYVWVQYWKNHNYINKRKNDCRWL